ncbi:hypothetical protein RRG08_028150 [Elysia crispata]|uniref:TNFR-Cys domain-containing protein n=1 Tax=Elysia crispata TaxID=231223 RepID=A0AAE0YQM0_9GAST|nr:hypothetical protein RRG08_028150 [Elysia crispata]
MHCLKQPRPTLTQRTPHPAGTMKGGVLLALGIALLASTSYAAEPCGARGRSCVKGQAECVDGQCVCKAPYKLGDGAFGCFKRNTFVAQILNDPMLVNFNNESVQFPYPCRYLSTHVYSDLQNKSKDVIGSCEYMIHSFNAKYRGKFFLHGFDVALNIKYDNGQSVKLSSRHYGVARFGSYTFKTQGTVGKFYENGPFQNDDITYKDNVNGVKVKVRRDRDNNQLIYDAKRCGLRITFVPYDIKDRRAQVSIPGMAISVNKANNPKWLSKDQVMALPPKFFFEDKVISKLSVEESMFVRAAKTKYIHNMPMKHKGKCDTLRKSVLKCRRSELRKAMQNCYWMLKQPRFIYCMDKSKSARNILRLLSKCVRVWCAGARCSDAQDMIIKAGCDTVRDVEELPAFISGAMCPTNGQTNIFASNSHLAVDRHTLRLPDAQSTLVDEQTKDFNWSKNSITMGFSTWLALVLSLLALTFPHVRSLLYCPEGTRLTLGGERQHEACEPCLEGSYNSLRRHRNQTCTKCTRFNPYSPYQILLRNCTRTNDTVIRCVDGFFQDSDSGWFDCVKCYDCKDQFEAEPCTWNENTKCCPQEGMRVVNGVCSFPTTSPNPTTTSAAAQDDPLPTNVNVGPLLTHVNVGCETCTRNLNALRSAQPARGEAIMLIVLAFISLSSLIVLLLAWSYLGRLVTRCLRSHR